MSRYTWAHTLWDGKSRPEDITPEYIQSLSIPEAVRLLHWMNVFAEAEKEKMTEGPVHYGK